MIDVLRKSDWYANARSSNLGYDSGIPKPCVHDADEGYSIQALVLKKLDWTVGGWKLGGTNNTTRERFCCDKAYFGPIENNNILLASKLKGQSLQVDALQGEPEIAFLVSEPINRNSCIQSPREVLKYFNYFAPAFECPISGIAPHSYDGLGDLLADLCGSGYLIIGNPVKLEMLHLAIDTAVNVRQNDQIISRGATSEIIGTVIYPLFELLNFVVSMDWKIDAGQWIATGGCAPCTPILPNREVIVDFESLDSFKFEFTNVFVE